MRKINYLLIFIFSFSVLSAQEKLSKEEKARREKNIQAGNPFAKYGYKAKVATLSKGKYLEFHDLDSIVTIGTSRWHVDNKKIVGDIVMDSLNVDAQPIGDAPGMWMSPDPLSEEFPSYSPYAYAMNNPVNMVDPDGRFPWPVNIRSFISTSTTGGGMFYGDGRNASFTGTSRVRSSFIVDPSAGRVTQPITRSDPTIFFGAGQIPPMVDRGSPKGANENINIKGNTASFDFSHSGKDPLTPSLVTPELDVHAGLSFTENLKNGTLNITGSFTGDKFPSTEAFITDQSGKTKLFIGAKMENGGITDLYGDNKVKLFNVNMQVNFDKKGNFTGVQQGDKTYNVKEWNTKVQEDFKK
ncbi:hypothetical protein [Flavobacterium psychrophilum]|uniref:hypothetical protein n=1 Tax=Flavobacterium psychrophilum TaxID=96345 RepID=UPI000B1A87B1|nr:hypothetical protein [Flavobacterium psychrophilum]